MKFSSLCLILSDGNCQPYFIAFTVLVPCNFHSLHFATAEIIQMIPRVFHTLQKYFPGIFYSLQLAFLVFSASLVTVLDWFKSYLSSRPFRVKCESSFSSLHTCFCGVPQDSVSGPLLFIMYTTPLSSLVSSLSLNHHLYADDTELFIFQMYIWA